MTTKSRVVYNGGFYRRSAAGIWNFVPQQFVNTTNISISGEHYAWRRQSDGGGPYASVSTRYEISPGNVKQQQFTKGNDVKGPMVLPAIVSQPAYVTPVSKDSSYGNAKGATAISRVLPTNPAAQLSTALGELGKDGLPQLIGSSAFKSQVHAAHKAGHEYLNYEFGWLPLVSDLKKFAYAVKHRDQIMYGYRKYSDKQIRRRYDFPSAETAATLQGTGYLDGNLDYPCSVSMENTNKVDEWFSGSFKYHIPMPDESRFGYYAAEASKILGLELTPEVVWNLAPWSWAVDWFSNTGDVIHNISRLGKDGLVMRYGYQMYRNESSRTYVSSGTGVRSAGFHSRYKKTEAVKLRWKASPYGFGLTWNGLTAQQQGVIAALGLSRAF